MFARLLARPRPRCESERTAWRWHTVTLAQRRRRHHELRSQRARSSRSSSASSWPFQKGFRGIGGIDDVAGLSGLLGLTAEVRRWRLSRGGQPLSSSSGVGVVQTTLSIRASIAGAAATSRVGSSFSSRMGWNWNWGGIMRLGELRRRFGTRVGASGETTLGDDASMGCQAPSVLSIERRCGRGGAFLDPIHSQRACTEKR